jgi:hypothetical protein
LAMYLFITMVPNLFMPPGVSGHVYGCKKYFGHNKYCALIFQCVFSFRRLKIVDAPYNLLIEGSKLIFNR